MPPEATDPISFDEALKIGGTDRRYSALLHPSWDGPATTHGGLLAAIALRAIDRETNADASKQIRSLTCQYLRAPKHGAIDIHVDPLRSGRRFSSTRAVISQFGRPCVSILSTHSVRDLPQLTSWATKMPDVPPPPHRDAEQIAITSGADFNSGWLDLPDAAPNCFKRIMISPRFGSAIYSGKPHDDVIGTENGGWVMLSEPRPIDPEFLAFLVDAFWPSVLQPMRDPAIAATLDLTIHFRSLLPIAGMNDQPLLVHNVSTAVIDGIADSDSRIYSADGLLLAQGRQTQLVAPLPA